MFTLCATVLVLFDKTDADIFLLTTIMDIFLVVVIFTGLGLPK